MENSQGTCFTFENKVLYTKEKTSEGAKVLTFASGLKVHYLNELLHRTDGKAVEYKDGRGEYWVMGKFYEEKEFLTLNL